MLFELVFRLVLIRGTQPIADTRFSEDILRLLGIGLDFLPELPNIYPQILRVGQIVPQFSEQKFVSEHLSCVLH